MNESNNHFAIVSGRANPDLVKKVAKYLKVEPVFLETAPWGNNYPRCQRPAEVTFAQKKVIIITGLQYREVGSPLEELELMFDACGSAGEIHLILTWFCGKDDVAHHPGQVPTAAWIARTIRELGPKSINVFDPHQSSHLELFYPARRRRFYFLRLLIEKARELGIDQVAATDFTSTKRAYRVENFLQTKNPIIVAAKDHDHQSKNSQLAWKQLMGKVVGKKVGLFDDMALSLSTLKESSRTLKEKMKAGEIYAFAAHFDPTPGAYDNLQEMFNQGWLEQFITTNSNLIDQKYLNLPGFTVVDVSKFVSEVAELIIKGESTSPLFHDI